MSSAQRARSPSRDSGRTPARVICHVLTEIRVFLKKHRARAYLVGGFLRDRLLGETSCDIDVVVEGAEPGELALHLHRNLGLSRPVVFPRFKTALTVAPEIQVEVCALQGRPAEDARQRDFTLDCLYAALGKGVSTPADLKIIDPTGMGLSDLRNGLLRTPVDPCVTLWLDPLRILRAFRLRAVRGFRLDGALRRCLPRLAYLLGRVAPERIRLELETILLSRRLVSTFREMESLGVCAVVLPELSRTAGYDQSTPYHAYDLFTHTLKTTANTPPDLVLRLAALLHDLGKPAVRAVKGGRAVYYGHEAVSARLADGVMTRLKFPRRVRRRVVFLVGHHMIHYSQAWTDRAVRRFVRNMGSELEAMLDLGEADRRAQVPSTAGDSAVRELRQRVTRLQRTGRASIAPPIDGRDIMRILGIPEGPLVGEVKQYLLDRALKRGRPMTREEAVGLVQQWAEQNRP